jgi:hypothetical protein
MIKRIISLLFAMLLLIGHAGAQDESIHLNFILKAGNEETPVSFDASFGRDEIRIVSELFPSYCLSLKGIPAADAFQCLRVENTEGFSVNPEYQKVVSDWISGLQSTVKKGIYAGDLFDEAYSVSEGICTSMAMFRLLQLLHICPLLSIFPDHCLSSFCPAESDPATIHFHVYESGKYLSFSGVVSEHTVFTSAPSTSIAFLGFNEKSWCFCSIPPNILFSFALSLLFRESLIYHLCYNAQLHCHYSLVLLYKFKVNYSPNFLSLHLPCLVMRSLF